MKPEILYDLPEELYFASTGTGADQWITRSMITDYVDDPASFYLKYIVRHPLMTFDGNNGTRFGTYFENYLLDRDVSKYTTKPRMCLSAKGIEVKWNLHKGQKVIDGGGQTTIQWEDEHEFIVSEADEQLAKFMEFRFSETALGKYWIKNIPKSKKQVTVRWQDEETGARMQIRLDNYLEDVFACDLKSTAKPYEKFSDTADNYGYNYQHAIYSDGLEAVTGKRIPFFFAVAESTGLKRARILQLHPTQVEYAQRTYKKALKGILAQDYHTKGFDSQEAEMCDLPVWLLYKYENES